MSSNDDGGDSGPGAREVAHRLFAAEFDDADLEYSESDEERAPNYVVTPTGLRVNRLFAVGVLTEVEAVNEQTNRGRIVDPTGAFVTYAGQYQPDAAAFLDRATPPAFVALTGKARTFQPEDSDLVYTSVRPESLATVDAETRDSWVVSAAEATLRRVAVFDRALGMSERGDALRARLEAAGVPAALASGIPVAIDHYDTGERYLEAVRTLAVDALEVVADEREEVRELTADPGERGEAELGPLPEPEYDFDAAPETAEPGAARGELTGDGVESTPGSLEEGSADEGPAGAGADADVTDDDADTAGGVDPVDEDATEPADTGPGVDATGADDTVGETDVPASEPTETERGEDVAEATDAAGSGEPTEPTGGGEAADRGTTDDVEPSGDVDAVDGDDDLERSVETVDTPGGSDATGTADTTEADAAGAEDDLGDFEDAGEPGEFADAAGPGDFDAGDEPATLDGGDEPPAGEDADPEEAGAEATDEPGTGDDEVSPEARDLSEADPEEFEDAISDEERRQVEAEHGVEFATGSNVPDPGDAGTEEPEADPTAPDEDRDVTPDLDTEPTPAEEGTEPTTEDRVGEGAAGETGTPYGEDEPEDMGVSEDGTPDAAREADGSAGGAEADDAAAPADTVDEDAAELADPDEGSEGEASAMDAEDVDLEAAAVSLMEELDDGDGVARDDVVAAAVDRYGADPADVEAAIQDALMSGKCYEPADGTLKPI